jgi:murein DD-endopeptidase MepM/ murein hydrolase activator NlpD
MRYLLVICILLRFVHPAADAQIECRGIATRGNPLLVLIRAPEAVEKVEVQLLSAEKQRIGQAQGFLLREGQIGLTYVALVGLPSTLRSGVYSIRAVGQSQNLAFRYSRRVEVDSRNFPFENIQLDERLTDLLTKKDPKKEEEARKLYALLRVFQPTAIYHTDFFSLPVMEDNRTAGFGDIRRYTFPNGTFMNSIHNGIDFGLVVGTPVYACGSGRVVFAGGRITTGNTVILVHLPGVYSLYFHLERILVDEGATVDQMEQIGTVGNTGLSTAAHLHWEVRVNGVAVDPEAFVSKEIVDMRRLSDVTLFSTYTTRKGGDAP